MLNRLDGDASVCEREALGDSVASAVVLHGRDEYEAERVAQSRLAYRRLERRRREVLPRRNGTEDPRRDAVSCTGEGQLAERRFARAGATAARSVRDRFFTPQEYD